MKIYFAGSIRGGREDAEIYLQIITELQKYGHVLTEHIGSSTLFAQGETERKEDYIYRRDIEWLEQSNVVVAEVTKPSLGVGYELAYAEKKGIRVICLFRKSSERSLSAMIRGNKYFEIFEYETFTDVQNILSHSLTNANHPS